MCLQTCLFPNYAALPIETQEWQASKYQYPIPAKRELGLFPVLERTLDEYIFAAMRTEIKDFMRMCERLIGLALQSGELSAEECDIISYYAKELHDTTHPLCDKHKCDSSVSR